MFVKVSVDGAPYLRKIDLKVYKSYADLLKALQNMFKLKIGKPYLWAFIYIQGLKSVYDDLNVLGIDDLFVCVCIYIGEYSEREGYNGSDYSPTYEDKDGDWMLVGDVPWE